MRSGSLWSDIVYSQKMKLNLEIETTRPEVNTQLIKKAAACALYYKGTLSSKEACDMIGIMRYEFEEIVPQYGFSILIDNERNIRNELSQR